jgi:hypothetical protein
MSGIEILSTHREAPSIAQMTAPSDKISDQ